MKKQLLTLVAMFAFVASYAAYIGPVATMVIPYADEAMDMNGLDAEGCYSDAQSTNLFVGTASETDYDQKFKVCYDKNYLYFYCEVTDDEKGTASVPGDGWNYDNIEVFFDCDTLGNDTITKSSNYDTTTIQIRFTRGYDTVTAPGRAAASDYEVYVGHEDTPGWLVEAAIPWKFVLGSSMKTEDMMQYFTVKNGFEVTSADADGTAVRDAQRAWDIDTSGGIDVTNNAYLDRRCLGVISFLSICGSCGNEIIENTKESIRIYPNPTTGTVYLKNLRSISQIKIMDLTGKIIRTVKITDNQIDLSMLANGMYIVKAGNNFLKLIKE